MENKISPQKTPNTLRKRDIAVLITTALVCDLVSLIPGENVIVSVFGQTVIPFIFSKYGINIFSFKRFVPYLIAFVIEMVPGASILPAFTLETIVIIYLSRKQLR